MMVSAIPDFLAQFADHAMNDTVAAGIRSIARPAHISIEGNRFTLVDAKGERNTIRNLEIEIVVVGSGLGISRMYFDPDEPYNPKAEEHNPPLCYSDNGVGPSINASMPQNPTCAGCPQAAWGSKISDMSGKGVPACNERKKLAVLFDGMLYQLTIPPNSLKNWMAIAKDIAKHKLAPNILRLLIYFDEKVQGTLCFKALGYACDASGVGAYEGFTDQKAYVAFMTKLKEGGPSMLDEYTGNNDKPKQGLLPKQQTVKEIAAAAPSKEFVTTGQGASQVHTSSPHQEEVTTPFLRQQAPQSAPPKSDKAPKKGNGKAATFGLVETAPVEDQELEQLAASAMGFLQE